jgi:hypothetical protein
MLPLGVKSLSLSFFLDTLSHGLTACPGGFNVLDWSCCLVLVELHGLTTSPPNCRVINSELDLGGHGYVCTDKSYLSVNPIKKVSCVILFT